MVALRDGVSNAESEADGGIVPSQRQARPIVHPSLLS